MSFSAQSRFKFLEAISPEDPGSQLEAAVFLAYSADLPSIFAVLLSLIGHDLDVSELEDPTSKPHLLLPKLVALKDRVRILVNPGGLNAYRLKDPILAGAVDQIVREVPATQGSRSSFHPKVSLVKFTVPGTGDSPFAKMTVSSRNLTGSTAMDIATEVELRPVSGRGPGAGAPGAEFIHHALTVAHGQAEVPAAILALLNHARGCALFPLEGSVFRSPRFFAQAGPSKDASLFQTSGLVQTGAERIVISPFLDVGGVERLLPARDGLRRRLLTASESLAKLAGSPAGLERLNGVECYVLNLEGAEEFEGLHAKVVVDGFGDRSRILVGSANATVAGWLGRNWEAVLSWDAPAEVFAQVCEDLFEKGDGAQALFRKVELTEFSTGAEPEDGERREIEFCLREMGLEGRIELGKESIELEVIAAMGGRLDYRCLSIAFYGTDVFVPFVPTEDGHSRAVLMAPIEELTLFCLLHYERPGGVPIELVRRVNAIIGSDVELAREAAFLRRIIREKGLAALLAEFMGGSSFGTGIGARVRGRRGGGAEVRAMSMETPSLEGLIQFCLQDPTMAHSLERLFELDGLDGRDAEILSRLRRIWMNLRPEIDKVGA